MSVALAFDRIAAGAADGAPPLVIAHGLLGQRRNWGALSRRFATNRDVLAVDMRNHGESPWSDRMDYAAMAEDLDALIRREAGGRATVLGHSMGGKAAMTLALSAPDAVAGLIVADMAPTPYSHSYAAQFAAMESLDLSAITRRGEADAALKPALPDFALRAFLLQGLAIEDGAARWRHNLAVLRDAEPRIVGWESPPEGAAYDGPTLFIAGGDSSYVTEAHRPEILRLFPNARLDWLAGAGHWLHAQDPDGFCQAVSAFLADAAL